MKILKGIFVGFLLLAFTGCAPYYQLTPKYPQILYGLSVTIPGPQAVTRERLVTI